MPALPNGFRAAWRLWAVARRRLAARARVTVVPLPEDVALPAECACCGGVAADSLREVDGEREVIVPYCTDCHFHASSIGTRRLAVVSSSVVFAATWVLSVPLLGLGLGPVTYVLAAVVAALFPLGVSELAVRTPAESHTAVGRAVWWVGRGQLACTSASFGRALTAASGQESSDERRREPTLSPVSLLGAMLALLLAPVAYVYQHPSVRVLNLGASTIAIEVDGDHVGTVEPTSQESPRAGVTVRMLVGTRTVRAVGPGDELVDDRSVRVAMGSEHLYAPSAEGACFWIETTKYGRERDQRVDRVVEPLGRGGGFWRLPVAIDTWFSPNPAASFDARSTGGQLTALRQAACLDAPRAVRGFLRSTTFAPRDE